MPDENSLQTSINPKNKMSMKTTALVVVFLLSLKLNAQIVDNVDITNDKSIEYIELIAISKPLSLFKVSILIDYGQKMDWKNNYAQQIKDKEGKIMIFNTPINALNYLYTLGWEVKDNYFLSEGNSNILHFLMKRKNESTKQINPNN